MVKELLHILLSPVGRITRPQFWWSWGLVLLLGYGVSQSKDAGGDWFVIITYIYLTYTIYGKRLHDLGRPASALFVPFLLHGVCVAGAALALRAAYSGSIGFQSAATWVALFGGVPYLVWLVYAFFVGLPVGEDADNRFGINPRREKDRAPSPGSDGKKGE